ncbi:hypothetical protein [Phosphitispora sp. TUW77]|uniref:hypothetical protein n=1 Tax=Phosphitispora sp. TUW77 TaxID=3152361 RepID=UPI003AB1C5F2
MYSGCKNKNYGTVSYRLLNKKIIDDNLDTLMTFNKRVNITESFPNLFGVDDKQVLHSTVSRIKKMVLNETDQYRFIKVNNLLSVIGEFYSGEQFVLNEIMAITRSRVVSKDIKILFLSFLVDIGMEEEVIATLFDLDELAEMAEFATDNLIGLIRGDLGDKLLFLQEFGGFDDQGQEEIMNQLAEDNTDAAAEMLGILAYAYEFGIASSAVSLLGKNLRARKVTVLNELASCNDKYISNLAMNVLSECNVNGRRKPSRRKWEKPYGDLYDAVVSSVDGQGNRAVWLAWKMPNRKNRIVAFNLLLNTDTGIKDCFGIPVLTKRDFESMIREISSSAVILRNDYEYCMLLIRGALKKNLSGNYPIPMEFAFWRRCMENDIYPEEYAPGYIDFVPETEKQIQDCYDRLDLLFEEQEFAVWYEETPEVYDTAEEIIAITDRISNTYARKVLKLENQLINRVIKPLLPVIKNRLMMTIDFLRRAGKKNLAREVVVCLITLDSVPAEQHPFIRRMCFESISAAINNLKNGIDIRMDPDYI